MIDKIIEISHRAGSEIMNYYNDDIEVQNKTDKSPLTKADLAAHHIIVNSLKKLNPDIPVLSEEGGIADYTERKKWDEYWLVDPLDGTKEFIKKNGEFTVNIALIKNNQPVLGVVYVPAKEKTYYGEAGSGSYKIEDGETQKLYSELPNLNKPVSVVSSRSHGSDDLEQKLSEYGVKIGEKKVAGSSLKFCLVAEGSADIYPRMGPTMEWDTAAGDAVYRYSGKNGFRKSPLIYNKPDLKNPGFIIGLE
jgi:3'(2'), 5'-bisphosphate nucleotidase